MYCFQMLLSNSTGAANLRPSMKLLRMRLLLLRRQGDNMPISVYRLGETRLQSCGQSISALRGKAGAMFINK